MQFNSKSRTKPISMTNSPSSFTSLFGYNTAQYIDKLHSFL